MHTSFSILVVVSLFLTSLLGFIVAVWIFFKFALKPGKMSDFHKFCLLKTIPDMFFCGTFLFWVVPVTVLELTYLQTPYLPNKIIGQTASGGAYIMGASIQMCMAGNRFFVIYFPFRSNKSDKGYVTWIAITVCCLLGVTYTLLGLRKLCAFVYDPDIFTWRNEEGECAEEMTTLIFWSIIGIAVTSNSFNVATGFKFLCTHVSGIRQVDAEKRRKKRFWLFMQCVVQDCLHLFDVINGLMLSELNDAIWYQFVFMCYSLLAIHAADGIVMFCFNAEVQPNWFRRIRQKTDVRTVVSSLTPMPKDQAMRRETL